MSSAWVDDKTVSGCQSCGVEFSLIVRKHHCRKCGKVICGVCSQNTLRLMDVCLSGFVDEEDAKNDPTRRVRVCDSCYEIHGQDKHKLLSEDMDAKAAVELHLREELKAKFLLIEAFGRFIIEHHSQLANALGTPLLEKSSNLEELIESCQEVGKYMCTSLQDSHMKIQDLHAQCKDLRACNDKLTTQLRQLVSRTVAAEEKNRELAQVNDQRDALAHKVDHLKDTIADLQHRLRSQATRSTELPRQGNSRLIAPGRENVSPVCLIQ